MKPSSSLRRLCGLVLATYPASWRARYGAELHEVLDQHQVTPSTLVDLALGALDAHRHTELGAPAMLSNSDRLRSRFVPVLLAGAVFGLSWAAVLSVRLRSSIGHTNDLQNYPDIARALGLVQIAGAISLLALLACIAVVASATIRPREQRAGLSLTIGVGLVASAAFVWLARQAGFGTENLGGGGQFLLMAVLAWVAGAACSLRMIRPQAPDPTILGWGLLVGRIGLISMAMTLAGSVVLTLAVSLEAPSMDAEILPILPMVVAVAWAAVAMRRVGADSTTDRRRLSGLGG